MAEHRYSGFRIREKRRALGLTQASVAHQAGISASYLNLIEANKRPIAGRLLNRIAGVLDTEPETLSGEAERRLVDDLIEVEADPLFGGFALEAGHARELVGRQPEWARAFLALYRTYHDQAHLAAALSDRLNQDPVLGDAVHQMLNHVTAIRSTSEILEDVGDLDAAQQRRFQEIIAGESRVLSDVAGRLANFFDAAHTRTRTVSASDEVDDFILEHDSYFPSLETAAERLRRDLDHRHDDIATALIDRLERRHGVTVRTSAPTPGTARFRNHCAYFPDSREFVVLDSATPATRRFQLARLTAQLDLADDIAEAMAAARFGNDDARAQAFRALAAYTAGALLFPYDAFLEDAVRKRYDIEALGRGYAASFEQVCHRLVTLHRPGAEGVPFGFLRADPAGYTAKRFPLPDLPLTRYGQSCPLWAIFAAFQTPERVVRQVAVFPDSARYLFVARTVTKQPATLRAPPFLHAVMVACAAVHAEQTVYADGLDLGAGAAVPVGPSCRLCPRTDCFQRAEDPIVGFAGESATGRSSI